MNGLQVRSKIWLETEGEPFLGEGRERLLRLIDGCGSISGAARQMGISYRKAWSFIENMEKRVRFPLVHRRKGGARGGTTTLTAETLLLLEKFDALNRGVQEYVDARFAADFLPANPDGVPKVDTSGKD